MTTVTVSKWIRVTKHNQCPVCGKPDWCLISLDGKAVICARIESDKPAGNKGAGWIHRLTEDTSPIVPSPRKETVNQLQKDSQNRSMSNLQYWSPGHQIYYWFGNAYGVPPEGSNYAKRGGQLVYLGTEQQVKDALATGRQSKRELVNQILDEERRRAAQGGDQ